MLDLIIKKLKTKFIILIYVGNTIKKMKIKSYQKFDKFKYIEYNNEFKWYIFTL